MKEMIVIADTVNDKINRVIKALESTKGPYNANFIITILECLKVEDLRINTDGELYVMFKDKEIIKINI